MGVCCSHEEIPINKTDKIKIIWNLNSSYDNEKKLLIRYINKAEILATINLKKYLFELQIAIKENKANVSLEKFDSFLITTKSDAEQQSIIINRVNSVLKVFTVGEPDKNFILKTGNKFYMPSKNFRSIIKNVLKELQLLMESRGNEKIKGILNYYKIIFF